MPYWRQQIILPILIAAVFLGDWTSRLHDKPDARAVLVAHGFQAVSLRTRLIDMRRCSPSIRNGNILPRIDLQGRLRSDKPIEFTAVRGGVTYDGCVCVGERGPITGKPA